LTAAALRLALPEPVLRIQGKDVVEFSVRRPDKAAVVRRIAAAVDADAVVFVGDDLSDEDVFAAYAGDSSALMVRVGLAGETAAPHRVGGPHDMPVLLAALARKG
jgi:trehalose-6-phosphatase